MKNIGRTMLFAAVLGLVAGTAFAVNIFVDVAIPGINAGGTADLANPGMVIAKVKVNESEGKFTAKLIQGSAPNASGKKAMLTVPFSQTVEGVEATGTGNLEYKKPKKGNSKVTGDAAGTLVF